MILEEIFNNIFGNIAQETGIGLGGTDSSVSNTVEKGIKKGAALRKLLSRGVSREREKSKELASDNKKKISKDLRKDKDLTINKLISKRFVTTDDDGKKGSGLSLDEYSGDTEVEIPSTAIADVKYDPKSRVCHVKYVGGNKWYRFVNMTPQQFKSFMNASSKGRYVQRIMRIKNHDPNYPRTI